MLVIADGAAPTGFARVARSFLERLQDRWRLEQLLVHHREDPGGLPWPTHACDLAGDPFGHEKARRLVRALRPDAVLVLYDAVRSGHFLRVLAADRGATAGPALIVHTPPEGRYRSPRAVAALADADQVVSATPAGVGWLRDAERQAAASERPFTLPLLEVVPYGVDLERFRPAPEGRSAARRRLRELGGPALEGPEDAVWILCAQQNRRRKRLDVAVRAFARVAASCPRARLCLHTNPSGRRADGTGDGVDLPALVAALGVEDRVVLTAHELTGGEVSEHPRLDDEHLALLFASCDLGLNTSMVEGWGLVAFEHAATGAAQIVPGHSAAASLWGDVAVQVPAFEAEPVTVGTTVEERPVDEDVLVDELRALVDDDVRRTRLGRAARRRALDPSLSWDEAAAALRALVEQAIAERRGSERPTRSWDRPGIEIPGSRRRSLRDQESPAGLARERSA